MQKNILKISIICLFILNFVNFSYAMEGPVHHPDYYAGITLHILTNRDFSKHHQQNIEDAISYIADPMVSLAIKKNLEQVLIFISRQNRALAEKSLVECSQYPFECSPEFPFEFFQKSEEDILSCLKNPRASPVTKVGFIEQIFLKKKLEKFRVQAASVVVDLLTEEDLPAEKKAFLALQLFTNKSLGKYYEHEAAISAWKEFSNDKSVHSSISLAKEVIACKLLSDDKFYKHHKQAISVWKNLEISAKAFTACDILQNDSLSRHYPYAEKDLKNSFSSEDEIVPWYTKARLSKIIRKTRSKKLSKARDIALDYFNSLEDDSTTNEGESSSVSAQEEPQRKERKKSASTVSAQEEPKRKERKKSIMNPDFVY